MGKYVSLIEVGKKQQFIFKSNALAENIGASIIIKNATEVDAAEHRKKYEGTQVIYEGGGNALYIFENKNDGISFAKNYSVDLIKKYPGITLYLVGYEINENETIKDGITKCYELLAEKKSNYLNNLQMVDYGKTVRCSSTNMPASDYNKCLDSKIYLPREKKERPISAEAAVKYKHSQYQTEAFSYLLPNGYVFPKEGDRLGRTKGEKSYVSIIHIDGNRMGEKIRKFNENHIFDATNETIEQFNNRYIDELGKLSELIREKYEESVRETFQILANNMEDLNKKLSLDENNLPVRPLILAGDDICFMADGRIGIELARICIEKIKTRDVMGIPLNACGGVAIVKAHYPFSRAYELAEELCQNAKNAINKNEDASYIDWHIDQGELDDSLSDIRKQYIALDESKLTCRPYRIDSTEEIDSMKAFIGNTVLVGKNLEVLSRSKIKDLREAYRKGEKATAYYIGSMHDDKNTTKYNILNSSYKEKNGNKYCVLFDAIELMDVFVRMEG